MGRLKVGRKGALSDESLSELTAAQSGKDINKSSNNVVQLIDIIHKKRQAEAVSAQSNSGSVKAVGKTTNYKYVNMICPDVVEKPTTQDPRRQQVMRDWFTAISHLVTVYMCQGISPSLPQGRISPNNMLNFDAVSSIIGGDLKDRIRLAPGSKALLRELDRSAGSTHLRTKKRGVKQFYLTSADGHLVAAIIIVKDRAIKSLVFEHVGRVDELGYEVWLAVIPTGDQSRHVALDILRQRRRLTMAGGARGSSRNQEAEVGETPLNAAAAVAVDLTGDGMEPGASPSLPAAAAGVTTTPGGAPSLPAEDSADDLDLLDDLGFTQQPNLSSDETTDEEDDVPAASELDVILMELILDKVFLPCMNRRRLQDYEDHMKMQTDISLQIASSQSLISSSVEHVSLADELDGAADGGGPVIARSSTDVHSTPMLLTFDGDFAQIKATFRSIMSHVSACNIEMLKFGGGSSMMYQPNDLMRAHAIIKSVLGRKSTYLELEQAGTITDSRMSKQVDTLLTKLKIDKPSRDCFVNFARHLPYVLQKAFSLKTIRDGWISSGLSNYNMDTILRKCSLYKELTEDQATRIKAAVPEMAARASASGGIVTDSIMREMLGDIVSTEVANMDDRVITQQRSLWLNCEGVLKKRQEEEDNARRKKEAAVARLLAQRQRHVQEVNFERNKALIDDGTLKPLQGTPAYLVEGVPFFCANLCQLKRNIPQQGQEHRDDGWRGCVACVSFTQWVCQKKICQKWLCKHMSQCVEYNNFSVDALVNGGIGDDVPPPPSAGSSSSSSSSST